MMSGLATAGQVITAILGAGTVGGLVSGEVSRRLAARDQRRQHLRRSLTELLQVRMVCVVMAELRAGLNDLLPPEVSVEAIFPKVIGTFVNLGQVHERYEAAVNDLSSLDPLLAYQLRAKDVLPAATSLVFEAAGTDPQLGLVARSLATNMSKDAAPVLDEAILVVAKAIDRKTFADTQRILKKQAEVPEGAHKALQVLREMLPKLADAAKQATQVPS